jgi:hypothetical protein
MKFAYLLGLISINTYATQALHNFYCPQGNNLVQIGMTAAQVQSACGQPQYLQDNTNRLVQNVPVIRLTYNNINKGSVYFWNLNKVYNAFSLPSGTIITPLTVLIINNKVKSINFNGNAVESTGACAYAGSTSFAGNQSPVSNVSIQIGDPMNKVIASCGNPDFTDHSFMQIPIDAGDKPERWVYQLDRYSPAFYLLFIHGVLEGIEH